MKFNFLTIVLALLVQCISFAQDLRKADSLFAIINTLPPLNGTDADSTRIKLSLDMGDLFLRKSLDSTYYWYSIVLDTVVSDEKTLKYPVKAKLDARCLGSMANVMSYLGQTKTSVRYAKLSLIIAKKLDDKYGLLRAYVGLGAFYRTLGDYSESIKYLEFALEIAKESGDELNCTRCYLNLGNTSIDIRDFEKAKEYFKLCLDYATKNNYLAILYKTYSGLADVARYFDDYSTAVNYMKLALSKAEELGDLMLIGTGYESIGVILMQMGDYPRSLEHLEKSQQITQQTGNPRQIANNKALLGYVSNAMGDNKSAEGYFLEALELNRQFGEMYNVANLYEHLGVANKEQKKYKEALEYYNQAMAIAEENDFQEIRFNCLMNIGNIQLEEKKAEEARQYYEHALKIKEGEDDYILMLNLGMLEHLCKNYSKALEYYDAGIARAGKLGNNVLLMNLYPFKARTLLVMGNTQEAGKLLLSTNLTTLNHLKYNFTILSEKEKGMLLENCRQVFNDLQLLNIYYGKNFDSLAGRCFNNELIFKGLLLKSTTSWMNVVMESGDSTLKNTYKNLKQIRKDISLALSSGSEVPEKQLADLEKKANEEEKKLVKLSAEYANYQNLFDYTWTDVRQSLKPGEAAIEFIRVMDGEKLDSAIYAAMILKKNSGIPVTIKLFSEQKLNSILEKAGNRGVSDINNLYKNTELYQLIWAPLSEELKDVQTVYYAPTGSLLTVSFAAISTGTGTALCDKYNLQQLSTTGLLIQRNEEDNIGRTAAVFGGINYDTDSVRNVVWKYLPGTLTEKTAIEKQLVKNGFQCRSYSGKEAGEVEFKALFGMNVKSPEILHVSTHGFFFRDPDAGQEVSEITRTEELAFRGTSGFGNWMFVNNKDPMMRSGLVLAGANMIWSSHWDKTDNEGVLTAYEVSNLNMNNTKLVVLSACETGLGDVSGNEGVYGLQRAFKMAGARYLIISLWQVPDKETVEFMEAFYNYLMKTGSVRKSFLATQKDMKKKYDPYFWAAFILVE